MGKALWERMWDVLQREGRYLGLSTTLDHPVLHFYERYGFHAVGLQYAAGGQRTVWNYSRWQGALPDALLNLYTIPVYKFGT